MRLLFLLVYGPNRHDSSSLQFHHPVADVPSQNRRFQALLSDIAFFCHQFVHTVHMLLSVGNQQFPNCKHQLNYLPDHIWSKAVPLYYVLFGSTNPKRPDLFSMNPYFHSSDNHIKEKPQEMHSDHTIRSHISSLPVLPIHFHPNENQY